MQLNEAYKHFSRAYDDRDDTEIPLMQKLCTFSDKSVLEITPEKSNVHKWLAKKYTKYVEIRPKDLKSEQREFDVVFTRWTMHLFDNLEEAVTKMCSLAKECVLVVLPSESGDLTDLKMIKDKETTPRRRKRVFEIEQAMKKTGFHTTSIPSLLTFKFRSFDEAMEVLMATEFQNSISHQELQEVRQFLEKRAKKTKSVEITQGAMFIAGSKR